ncbi:MAG: hypothetical protein WC233_07805 [Sphaerochaeta sp.]|jgi:hypothetical protein
MRKSSLCILILLAIIHTTIFAAVHTTSLGGFYSFGYINQNSETYSGTAVGLNLRTTSFFKSLEKFGIRYDLRAAKSLKLKENNNSASGIKGFDLDLGVALAYQQRLTYLSFVEAGLGIQAIGTTKQYTTSEDQRVNQHLLLGVGAFLDYHYALKNKFALNIGANAKMPLIGFARYGAKNDPKTGRVTAKGLEISPHVGVTFIF